MCFEPTSLAMMFRLSIFFAAVAVASACPFEISAPETDLDGLPEGLEISLDVEPDAVAPHAPFTATLIVRNTSSESISITTSSTCLAVPSVLRDDTRVPFVGSTWGCGDAITTHVIPAGEMRTRAWSMRAELYAEEQGDPDGAPAPRGRYWVQAEFDVHVPGVTRKPSIATMLRVW